MKKVVTCIIVKSMFSLVIWFKRHINSSGLFNVYIYIYIYIYTYTQSVFTIIETKQWPLKSLCRLYYLSLFRLLMGNS